MTTFHPGDRVRASHKLANMPIGTVCKVIRMFGDGRFLLDVPMEILATKGYWPGYEWNATPGYYTLVEDGPPSLERQIYDYIEHELGRGVA